MARFLPLESILVERLSIKNLTLATIGVLIPTVERQKRLHNLLNANLLALGTEATLTNIDMAKVFEFRVNAILVGVITVLIPSRDLVLRVIELHNVVYRLGVSRLN